MSDEKRAIRAVKRIRNPYQKARRDGDGRLRALRFALMVRRSGLGPRGWLPYRNYLRSTRDRRSYKPSVKQWHWRRWTIWRNRRELRRQDVEAQRRWREGNERFDAECAANGGKHPLMSVEGPTERDLEHARRLADEMGWLS